MTEVVTNPDNPLFIIIDGHSLAFRAYYAFAKGKKGALKTSRGIPTSVCFGFLNSLFTIINDYQPQFFAVAFDLKEATFRHSADKDYKADRQETPLDFIEDITNLQRLLTGLNISIVTAVGYEADDVIGTLANQGANHHCQVKILSGDQDLFQLVDNQRQISVLYLQKNIGKYELFNEEEVINKMGVKPSQIVDYKALCGDKSDSIQGVIGIGEKTAIQLLGEYPSLDDIYANLDSLKPAVKNKLIKGKDSAFHSQFLAKIVTDIDLNFNLDDCYMRGFNPEEVIPLLQSLELHSFIKQIDKINRAFGKEVVIEDDNNLLKDNSQLSLFPQEKKKIIFTPMIIDSLEKLENLVNIIKLEKLTAWDTETDSLDTQLANLVGVGVAWGKSWEKVAYIPLQHQRGNQLSLTEIKPILKEILEEETYLKTLHNSKFDRTVLFNHGLDMKGVVFDTMLASYVLQPEESHKLSNLCYQYSTDFIAKDFDSLDIGKGENISNLPIDYVAQYCALDVLATYELTEILEEKLNNIPSLKPVFDLELKLEPILAKMEQVGVLINPKYLEELSEEIEQELLTLENNAYDMVGEFNLASPKQLSELLFEKLGLNKKKSTKTKTGYSTNQAILEKLKGDHPIIELILQHRTLAKLKSTYVDALPSLINAQTNRVHTNYNQTVTATGRLSSSNPNLQNIPIRTAFSRQIRQAFIPRHNWLFLGADYSQIELRILAHLSEDPILISAYENNLDIHTVTAQLLLDKENITPTERNLGKTINFGVIYGMGAQKFSRETKVDSAIAQKFIEIYREKYASVFNYLEKVKKEALVNGYVTTILGRRRYFNFPQSELKMIENKNINEINLSDLSLSYQTIQSLRAAANAPIQGSSADIIKLAMLKVNEILADYQGELLLQVHDELVLELPPEEVENLPTKIKEAMENVMDLKVPLLVDIHLGNNWMEAK